jgi:hypothetical protein
MPGPGWRVPCIDERPGAGQRCRSGSQRLDLIDRIEAMLSRVWLDIPILRRACPARCEWDPVMRSVARGPCYAEIDITSLRLIGTEFKHRIDRRNGTDA